jgi:hypothetical protein
MTLTPHIKARSHDGWVRASEITYHRNGVGGEGFYAVRFYEGRDHYLGTVPGGDPPDASDIRVVRLTGGGVDISPDARVRGSDVFGPALIAIIQEAQPVLFPDSYPAPPKSEDETPHELIGKVTGFNGRYTVIECPAAPAHLRVHHLTPAEAPSVSPGEMVILRYRSTPSSGEWYVWTHRRVL